MRYRICVFFALILSGSAGWSQTKVSDKAAISTPYVQCDKCREQVEFFIAHEYGVTSVRADTRKHTTTVTWLTDRTTIDNIRAAIANLGFDADDIEAEPFAYKRLPKECRMHKENAKRASVSIRDSVRAGQKN